MESAGYVLRIREPDWHQHRLFKGPDTDINLHVYSFGCPEIDKMLMFRDWLRINDADRELYERTKRELAKQTWKYVQNYADAKTAVVEEIVARPRPRGPHPRLILRLRAVLRRACCPLQLCELTTAWRDGRVARSRQSEFTGGNFADAARMRRGEGSHGRFEFGALRLQSRCRFCCSRCRG